MADEDNRWLDGRYRIDSSLGKGGMSEVFVGYDERLDRRVAIKILSRPPDLPAAPDSPEAAARLAEHERNEKRFVREVRTTARLELAGIPSVYDTGKDKAPDGTDRLWLVMQLLPGTTLRNLLDKTDFSVTPPPVSWAAGIVTQVAAVLAEVHSLDIVHRDIKPENLVLGDGGVVKVLDFGIAILRGASGLPRLTEVGMTVGTTEYMSPEQCLGKVVSSASDIYSLGCLLHQLLTGQVPFRGPAEVLRNRHLHAEPPSASEFRVDVPGDIDELLTAMLAKDFRSRPGASQVYDALLPTAMAGLPSGDENRDPTRPFRRPLLAPAARAVDRPTRDLSEGSALELLVEAENLVVSDQPMRAVELLEDVIAGVGQDAALGIHVRRKLAAALVVADQYTRAAQVYDSIGHDLRTAMNYPPGHPRVLDCAYQAGLAYAKAGKPDLALPQFQYYAQNARGDAEQVIECRYLITQLLLAQGDPETALAELQSVRDLVAARGGPELADIDKQIARLRPAPLPQREAEFADIDRLAGDH
jgi:serine/threonine protein kinase